MRNQARTRTNIRVQPRLRGNRRTPVSSAVTTRIEDAIRKEMRRYGCSRSFVIAVALAYTFDIELSNEEDYHAG